MPWQGIQGQRNFQASLLSAACSTGPMGRLGVLHMCMYARMALKATHSALVCKLHDVNVTHLIMLGRQAVVQPAS